MANEWIVLLIFTFIGFTAAFLILVKNRLLHNAILEKDEMLVSRERLLHEVHHRVKNNLHTVVCLLESQARYLKDDALAAIQSSAHRIHAMLSIHQKLNLSKEVKAIDMAEYLGDLFNYLEKSFGTQGEICFQLEVTPLKLLLSKAIPIALIINEAVTNSIKHAFPGKGKGIILVRITQRGRAIHILIKDNGIGMEEISGTAGAASYGLKLMKGLSEDIDGEISFENRNGTLITLKVDSAA